MSAERLREAADRLEALADEASEGPWRRMSDPITGRAYIDEGPDTSVVATQGAWRPDMAYIAAMHPLVGKALAAWLRAEAEDDDPCPASTPADCYVRRCSTHHALAVADAILGGDA